MNLFLATFRLQRTSYMEDRRQPPSELKMRIIKAFDENAAERLLSIKVERHDPYGVSYSIVDLDISECISAEDVEKSG